MLHPLRSGRSLISAVTYFPACSHTCVRAKHGRSASSSRPRSASTPAAPILTAAAAFDSVVSTNKGIDRRLPFYARQHPPAADPLIKIPSAAAVLGEVIASARDSDEAIA